MKEIVLKRERENKNESIHSWWVCVFKHCVQHRVTVHHWINFFIAYDSNYWITRHISQFGLSIQTTTSIRLSFSSVIRVYFVSRDFNIWKKTHSKTLVVLYILFIKKRSYRCSLFMFPPIDNTRKSISSRIVFINIQRYVKAVTKLWNW